MNLVSGEEIAEIFTYYYAYSEQTPTAMNLGVLIGTGGSGGSCRRIFLQLMPDADEEVISKSGEGYFKS